MSSDEDEAYKPGNEGSSSEDEINASVRGLKSGSEKTSKEVPKQLMKHQPTKSGYMAEFVNQPVRKQDMQKCARPLSKSGSMAEFVKQSAAQQVMQQSVPSQSHEEQKQQQEAAQKPPLRPVANQVMQRSVPSQSHEEHKQQQEATQKPSLQSQKKQLLKKICLPESLSKYREFKKKQVRNIKGDVVIENHCDIENEVESDFEQSSGLEREAECVLESVDNTNTIALESASPSINTLIFFSCT